MPSVKVNLSHQQIRPLKARFLDHVSLWINDLRTPETRKLPVPADDVGADHPNPMPRRQCDVRTSCRGIQIQRSAPIRQAVVGWDEEDGCVLDGHASRQFGVVGVIADHDAEGQFPRTKYRGLRTGLVYRSPNGRMNLSVNAGDSATLIHDRGIVQAAVMT
jgi:hypothetical protein